MKKAFWILFTTSVLLAVLFYFGGYALLVGLGVIGLTSIILVSFVLGVKMAHKLMTEGARLAIESASRNDQHDAQKITALADLTREALKVKREALPPAEGYPAIPPFVEGAFTIQGLESEDIEQ